MINTQEQNTTVKFGTGDKASIGVSVNGSQGNKVTLQQLSTDKTIGDKIDITKDVSELPKVVLDFTNVNSVNALIGALEAVRRNMLMPPSPNYADAC